MAKLIGLDVGTSSICALLLDTDRPREAVACSVENDCWLNSGDDRIREQDPAGIWRRVQDALNALAARAGRGPLRADGLAVTGQMHGVLLTDGEGTPVSPLITWQDLRAVDVSPRGRPYLEEFSDAFAPEQARSLGMRPAAGYMGPTLYAMQGAGQLPEAARHAWFIYDWVAAEMAGASPFTTPQTAQSSGMYSALERRWQTEVAGRLGMDCRLLPPVTAVAAKVGTAVGEVPVRKGTPVFAAPGDNQASFLGSVRDAADSILINVGTGAQISVAVSDFISMEGADTRLLWEDGYLLVGASLCGGRAFSLLADFIAHIGQVFCGSRLNREKLYSMMVESAVEETALRCRTTLAGTRAEPELRGLIAGLSEGNFTIEELIRATANGIIEELKRFYDAMAAGVPGGLTRGQLVGSGNGLRRNRLLRQSAERAFGTELRIPLIVEEAALGAALTAAIGAGVYASPAEAAAAVSYVET